MSGNRSDNLGCHTPPQEPLDFTKKMLATPDDIRVIKESVVLQRTKSFEDILKANRQRVEEYEKKHQPKHE